MGNSQSTRATNFERPDSENDKNNKDQEFTSISISNKMVERLVEDVALKPKPSPKPAPKSVFKDTYFNEKLNNFDEEHSRQWGLTVKDVKNIANRIDRTSNTAINPDESCVQCAKKVLDCYETSSVEPYVCTGVVDYLTRVPATGGKKQVFILVCYPGCNLPDTFKDCVRKATRNRVRERTLQAARNEEERSRNMARAKENVLQKFAHEEVIPA